MKHIITHNDLLLYMHNEVSFLERMAIERELKVNLVLQAELEELRQSCEQLDIFLAMDTQEMEPSNLSIQNILNYSQESSHSTTQMF